MSSSFQKTSFQELLGLVYRKITVVVMLPLAIAIFVAIGTLFLDNEYRSAANLLPAQQRTVGLESILGGRLGGLAGGIIGGRSTPFDRYLVLLTSETVSRKVIDEFNLIEVYELENSKTPTLDAIKKLKSNTAFSGQREGNFIIEVWDKSPELARDITQYYVDILNNFNNEIGGLEATAYREFVEGRYLQAFADVDSLRRSLAEFQRTTGIFELPEQAKSYFAIIANVTAEKMQVEIETALIESTFGRNSSQYRQASEKLAIISSRLKDMYTNANENPVLLDIGSLPDVGMEYYNLLQNIEIQSEILKFIVPVYEQAKLEEQKALPSVTVVDPPRIAEKKGKPFRALITLSTLFSSFLIILFSVIASHIIRKNSAYFADVFKN
jgi:tyrosine-protein kinase Etk/Wzc